MNRILLPFFALFMAAPTLFGQMERTLYQSFEIDSVRSVNLDFTQDFDLYEWAGNTILIETHVQLFEASPTLLDFFVKQKRYHIDMVRGTEEASIAPLLPDRKPIKTARGECTEVVTVKVFVPDNFEWELEDRKHLTAKPPSN